ncbi:MAG: NAD(P)-binding domain-containing protein [Actinobacteria bacterium]|nr:NAD(P)-binding domain-containing protein [Actinomycetota bacterium]
MSERVGTVVIGAGQAGLATSYHLTQRGHEHVVFERGRVGETWRSQRWDNFVLNTPNWAQQLPGFEYRGPEPDGFAPLAEVIAYLEDYARAFDAPVRNGVDVTYVRRSDGDYLVETSSGTVQAANVVVAGGAYQWPTSAPLAARVPADVVQLHTSEYHRPQQLPPGGVLVVGSGQSGCQISEELLAAGRAVYLSVGRCPWLPRRYRRRELVHWLIETGLADETADNLPSPAARLTCNPPVSGNDGGHDCNPRLLARHGAILLGRVEGIEEGVVQVGGGLEKSLANGEEFVANFKRRVDEHIEATGMDVPAPEPDEPDPPIPHLTELDLRSEGVDTILWANGFRPDHSWIEGVQTDEQGWPVHERGVSPLPGLFFVGLHWLHKRKSSLFLGVGEDAAHVVEHLESRDRRV